MSKIKSIQLNNFKFFRESEPIVLDGKHLLLYGENGSGKSSIYWGIYTLLEAAFKKQPQIEPYFKPLSESDASLVNIYAQPDSTTGEYDSYIKLTLDDGKELILSANDMSIIGDSYAQETRRMSDFLNYQSLFAFQQFRHGQENDLFDIFNYSILPYVSFAVFHVIEKQLSINGHMTRFSQKDLSNAIDMWNEIKEMGPGERYNGSGKIILVYKDSPEYQNFEDLVFHFNMKFKELIDFINATSTQILKKLEYPELEVELEYTDAIVAKKDTWIDYTDYKISFVVKFNGIEITKPNTFLNEARLSAIALAIRLAVLDRTYIDNPTKLHLLVLDDIMISLDMGNRTRLIKLILKEGYANKYQILFFTHSRVLVDTFNKGIDIWGNEFEWMKKEMYEFDNNPIIQNPETPLSKAYKYYKGSGCDIDYNACGNNQRQALEKILKGFLRHYNICNEKGKTFDIEKMMLNDCIIRSKALFKSIGFDESLLDELDFFRTLTFNPTSHFNPKTDYYSFELKRTFEIIEKLQEYKILVAVPSKSLLLLKIQHEEKSHTYEFEIRESILFYYNGVNYSYSEKDKFHLFVSKCDGATCDYKVHYSLKDFSDKMCKYYNWPSMSSVYDNYYLIDGVIKKSLSDIITEKTR